MNTGNKCRITILFILVIATCIVSCTGSEDAARAQRDTNIRNEISTVEGQIRQIDKKIEGLIRTKGSHQQLGSIYGEKDMLRDMMTDTSREDSQISKLKSEREMLIVRLTALHQSLNK